MTRRLPWFALAAILLAQAGTGAADIGQPAAALMAEAVKKNQVVGAQIVVGNRAGITREWSFGATAPEGRRPVDGDTRFCIGSVSKPLAAACVLILADRNTLPLDRPIDRWLPAFSQPALTDGKMAGRAPNLSELLAHRGGIYSQKRSLTREQTSAIRDFHRTLDQAVAIIARQPLLQEPGTDYAYSGAGYCVIGRAIEVATGDSFEHQIQQTVLRPIGMGRSTYFPDPHDANIAVGGTGGKLPASPEAPHLFRPNRLALVGGSLYSTGRDLAAFARMVMNHGRAGETEVEAERVWQHSLSRRFPGPAYGYGWTLAGGSRGVPSRCSHSGALFSYRCLLVVDLARNAFLAATWTLANGTNGADTLGGRLERTWTEGLAANPPAQP